jgi:hypothetical protein
MGKDRCNLLNLPNPKNGFLINWQAAMGKVVWVKLKNKEARSLDCASMSIVSEAWVRKAFYLLTFYLCLSYIRDR